MRSVGQYIHRMTSSVASLIGHHAPTRIMFTFAAASLAVLAIAQTPVPGANQGVALTVTPPQAVKEMVSIQAVMLPYTINKELFSKHIALNYAVVVINVGNRSHDAALVMQGLYLDYSKWAMSGAPTNPSDDFATKLRPYSTATSPGHVSSVEYRIVRGQLEERDPKTARNWILRSLQLAGAVAGATTFVYGPMSDIPKFLTAANGVGIPGFEKLWPDALITKLNRISDFGYRTNRIIPRESSEIMIAFFPIDRFLTNTLKEIYINHPAVFFNTGLALVDPSAPDVLKTILAKVAGVDTFDQLTRQIPAMINCKAGSDTDSSDCKESRPLRRMVSATSLNTIEVVIDGSMVIDLSAIPAVIDSVEFQDQGVAAAFWSTPSPKDPDKAVIVKGRNLDGARLIVEPKDAGIDSFTIDEKNSSSERLAGRLKFSKSVANGQTLAVKVEKDTKDGRTITSSPYPLNVKFVAEKPADLKSPSLDDKRKLTLTGKNLGNPNLFISITRTAPQSGPATLIGGATVNPDGSVSFDLQKQAAGCYSANLFAPDAVAAPSFLILPSPSVTQATQSGNHVDLKGTEMFVLKTDCTTDKLSIKILDDKGVSTDIPPTAVSAVDATGVTAGFDFVFPAGNTKWQVQVSAGTSTSKPVPIGAKQ